MEVKTDGRIAANKKRRKVTDEQILEDIQAGLTRREIADKRGVHVENLARRMRMLGVHATYAPNPGGKPKKIYGECWHYVESQDKAISKKQPDFQYLETRKVKGSGRVRLKCKYCHNIIERSESTTRSRTVVCEYCDPLKSKLGDETKILQNKRIEMIRFLIALKESKTPKICKGCGQQFYSQYSTQLYCSKTCKQKAKKLRFKEKNPELVKLYRARTRNLNHYYKRAKKYGCVYIPGITRKKVVERDNNICQICGKNCDPNDKRWGSFGPDYPTLDHIIPLSKKGPHTWDNVQCVCGLCNSEKRDLYTVKKEVRT